MISVDSDALDRVEASGEEAGVVAIVFTMNRGETSKAIGKCIDATQWNVYTLFTETITPIRNVAISFS